MTQSRRLSVVETTCNIGSGVFVAWLLTMYVLPMWGYAYTGSQAVEITATYSIVSWFRSYLWRRFFVGRFE